MPLQHLQSIWGVFVATYVTPELAQLCVKRTRRFDFPNPANSRNARISIAHLDPVHTRRALLLINLQTTDRDMVWC